MSRSQHRRQRGYATQHAARFYGSSGFARHSDDRRSTEHLEHHQTMSSSTRRQEPNADFNPAAHRRDRWPASRTAAHGRNLYYNLDSDNVPCSSSEDETQYEPQLFVDQKVDALHHAYSEPVQAPSVSPLTGSHCASPPQTMSHNEELHPAERQALLERIRHLSAREAETAATLAQATAENAALSQEAQNWQNAAREAAAARRAAREALSEVSSENARLAAAYSAQRLEAEALRNALEHERAEADARIDELEAALAAAQASIGLDLFDVHDEFENAKEADGDLYLRKGRGDANGSEKCTTKTDAQTHGCQGQNREDGAASPDHHAAWDQERTELLSLLERLQEQLATHAARQKPSPFKTTPNDAMGTPPCKSGAMPQRVRTTPPARSGADVNRTPLRTANNPNASHASTPIVPPEQAPGEQSPLPKTPLHTRFSVTPDVNTQRDTQGGVTTPHRPSSVPLSTPQRYDSSLPKARQEEESKFASRTPATYDSLGVEVDAEASFESTTIPAVHSSSKRPAEHEAKSVPANAKLKPEAVHRTEPSTQAQSHSAPRRPGPAQRRATPIASAAVPSPQAPCSPQNPKRLKAQGDLLAQSKRYHDAIQRYTAALKLASCSNCPEPGSNDNALVASLLCARAAALNATGRPFEAAADCCRAERADQRYTNRAIDVRSAAYVLMGAYDLAVQELSAARNGASSSSARLQDARRRITAGAPRNHYAILGLKPTATSAEIKVAYKSQVKSVHPDKATAELGSDAATVLFALLSEAHATLMNTQSRRAYDLQLLRSKYSGDWANDDASATTAMGRGGAGWGPPRV
jgi:tetratricopeptide (TPR) repeat protein